MEIKGVDPACFAENDVDGALLLTLDSKEEMGDLGISSGLAQKKLLRKIQELGELHSPPSASPASAPPAPPAPPQSNSVNSVKPIKLSFRLQGDEAKRCVTALPAKWQGSLDVNRRLLELARPYPSSTHHPPTDHPTPTTRHPPTDHPPTN